MDNNHRHDQATGGMPVPAGMTAAAGVGAVLLAIPVMAGLERLLEGLYDLFGHTYRASHLAYRALWNGWDAGFDMPMLRLRFVVATAGAVSTGIGTTYAALRGVPLVDSVPPGLALVALFLVAATRVTRARARRLVVHRSGNRDWLAIAFSLSTRLTNIPTDASAVCAEPSANPAAVRAGTKLPSG